MEVVQLTAEEFGQLTVWWAVGTLLLALDVSFMGLRLIMNIREARAERREKVK